MITSKHDNRREDRVWDFSCKKSFDSFSSNVSGLLMPTGLMKNSHSAVH
uniref:Uncharacterized protein n=1 Tax=Anguilla anguilla TaxID=7936 RepID=A0A0E9TDG3_ANGAN